MKLFKTSIHLLTIIINKNNNFDTFNSMIFSRYLFTHNIKLDPLQILSNILIN